MTDQLKKILEMIKNLTDRKFYGKLTINFRDGKPVASKLEETFKLD